MWTLVKEILSVLIGVYIISQIILPCFLPNLEFFNIHKSKKQEPKPPTPSKVTLDDLEEAATVVSSKMKEVKTDIDATEEKIKNIKNTLNN